MDIYEIARNTFTIAALLLTASLILLNYSYKRLKNILRTMPQEKQQIKLFRYKSILDSPEHEKFVYIDMQFIACVFFALSFAGALLAVFEMSGVMVGDVGGIYAADDFEFAVVSMRVGVFCLFAGALSHGGLYLEDIAALLYGQPNRVTTKLEEMPKKSPSSRVWSNILAGCLCVGIVIMGLINLLIETNQWIKMTLSLIIWGFLFLIVLFARRIYLSKKSSRKDKEPPITKSEVK